MVGKPCCGKIRIMSGNRVCDACEYWGLVEDHDVLRAVEATNDVELLDQVVNVRETIRRRRTLKSLFLD